MRLSFDDYKAEWEALAMDPERAFDFPTCDEERQVITGSAYFLAVGKITVIVEVALSLNAARGVLTGTICGDPPVTEKEFFIRKFPCLAPQVQSPRELADKLAIQLTEFAANVGNTKILWPAHPSNEGH
jgi:hypothetical protein